MHVNNATAPVWTNITVTFPDQASVTGNVYVARTPEQFTYDLDGNLLSDGRWNYTWDTENRMTQVESLSTAPTASKRRVVWEFDARGRRIRQTTYDGSSGSYVVTEDLKFLSDGWRNIAELNATNNAFVRSYLWGLDMSGTMGGAGGVGGLLLINSAANGAHFFAYDGNGNAAGLVKAADGTISARYEYDPFGQILRATGAEASENRFQFSTKRNDRTTDLELYEYRVRRADLAWLSRDPAEEDGGDNLYVFVGNDPILFLDEFGLEWKVIRSQGADRALASGDCGDTVSQLAVKIHLDPGEYQKWLQVKYGPMPASADEPLKRWSMFSIPNKVYVNRVGRTPTWVIGTAARERRVLRSQGFSVVKVTDPDNDAVRKQLADADIYGFVNVAHGESEPYGHGEIETTDPRGIGLTGAKGILHHKLGGFMLIQCWGDEIDWRQILGPGAYYWGGHGSIHYWQIPNADFAK